MRRPTALSALLVFLVAAAAWLAVATPAAAAFRGKNGQPVFWADRDGPVHAYTMNPDGTGAISMWSMVPGLN
jgi:hypothetical protein